ncbi:Candidapepsin-3 [Seiridium cupressi]
MVVFFKLALATFILSLLSFARIAGGEPVAEGITSEKFKDSAEKVRNLFLDIHSGSMLTREFPVTVGTGSKSQVIQVLLDTGSYELWVDPNCAKSNVAEMCKSFGHYDPALSPTSVDLEHGSEIRYGLGNTNISYFTDDIFIAGGRVQKQQFGVATDSEKVWFGIMGLGYGRKEPGSPGTLNYSSVTDNLYDQKYTNSRLFGLELGSQGPPQIAITGQIIFGGLDTNKFAGRLSKIPLDRTDPHYRVTLSSISHRAPTSLTSTSIMSTPLSVIIDSGTTLSLLPQNIVESIASKFPGAVYDGDGGYRVPCCHQSLPGSLDFNFGGVTITVPYSEFIWNSGFYNGEEHCSLGAQWDTTPDPNPKNNFVILGDTFIRAAYTVFDQDNHALYMANYVKCGSGSATVPVPAGPDAAADIQGKCQAAQTSVTANLGTCTGTVTTSYTSTPTGTFFTGDPDFIGPVSMSSSATSSTSVAAIVTSPTKGGHSSSVAGPSASRSTLSIPTRTTPAPRETLTTIPKTRIILGVLSDGGAAKNATAKRSLSSNIIPGTNKRQSDGGFIGNAGPDNPSSCSDATGFNLTNGQLVNGGQSVNTEPGMSSMTLHVSPSGSINTTFLVVDSILHWFNNGFFGGEASFCQTSSGRVHVVFTEHGTPAGCTQVSLVAYQETQCQDGELILSAATPPSPTTSATASDITQFPISQATVTDTITSTVTNSITYTITACPPSIHDCPVGQITTTIQVYVTTICPEDQASPALTQPPSSPSASPSDGSSANGGNTVAVVVTVTEECETSTVPISTCAVRDPNCRSAISMHTRYRTITVTHAVASSSGSARPAIAPGSGVQVGALYNNSADACQSCAGLVSINATANLLLVQAGAVGLEIRTFGIMAGGLVESPASASLILVTHSWPPSTHIPLLVVAVPVTSQRRQRFSDPPSVHFCGVQDAHLCQSAPLYHSPHDERERLFDIDFQPRARLHESAAAFPRPVQPLRRHHLSRLLQIALVPSDEFDGRYRPVARLAPAGARRQTSLLSSARIVESCLGFHVNEVIEIAQRVQAVNRSDVVHEEERVGAEVGGCPHAAVFFLAGRVGQREVVGRAIDAPRNAIAVLYRRVVVGGPLRAHEAQRDARLSAAAVAAYRDRDGDWSLRGIRRAWHL